MKKSGTRGVPDLGGSSHLPAGALYAERPALAVVAPHELVRVIIVGDLHVLRVPEKFLPAGELAAGILDIMTAQGKVAHKDRFGQRYGIVERRAQLVLTI